VAAQPGQAAAADRPDAADRDAQPGADLGVGDGRVLDKQGQQPLAVQRQAGEGFGERGGVSCPGAGG
jgi:hypothetical protein